MRYLPFLLIFAVKTAAADSTYVYPAKLSREIPACVPEDKQLNELMITLSGSEPIYGERGKARYKQALDLNNDGSCEVFILPPAYLAGNVPLWQEVWTLKNGTYVRIGQVLPTIIEKAF